MALNIGELVAKLRIDNDEMRDGLSRGERDFGKFGDRVGALALVAGAGAAVAFGAALVGAMGAQDVGAKVAAQLGHTGEASAEYGKIAGDLYAENFGDSLEQIGDAIKEIQRAGILSDTAGADEIKEAAKQALILSSVFGKDLSESTRAVQQLIRNGLAKDAQEAFDIITVGIQTGVDKSDDLLDTFNEYSVQFKALGLNGKEALGLLTQGLQAGARDADTVADALKEFAIRSKDGSSASAEGFKAIGLSGAKMTKIFAQGGPGAKAALGDVLERLRQMKDPAAQSAAAIALFGTKAEDMQGSLLALNPNIATVGMDNLAGATNRAGETVGKTAGANIESFKRQLEHAFVETLGSKVLPIVTKAAKAMSDDFGPALSTVGGWIKRNKEWLAPLGVALGTFAGIILVIVGAMKIWTAITAAYTVVQWALNTAMLANPIGLVVIALVALVAGLVYAYKHSETFRRIVDGAWSGIKNAISAVVGWITGTAWPWIKGVWDSIAHGAMSIWTDWIKPAFDFIGAGVAFVANIVTSMANVWLWLAGVVFKFVSDGITYSLGLIGAAVTWLYDTLIAPFVVKVQLGCALVGAAWDWLYRVAVGPAIDRFGSSLNWLWGIASWIFAKIGDAAGWVGERVKQGFSTIGGWISNAFSGAVNISKGAINQLLFLINKAVEFINNKVISGANKLPGVSFPYLQYLPYLASGGTVHPTPGGRPVMMGDGGQVEYGIPHSDMERIIGKAVAAGGGSGGTLTVVFRGDGILRGVRKVARVRGGEANTVLVGG